MNESKKYIRLENFSDDDRRYIAEITREDALLNDAVSAHLDQTGKSFLVGREILTTWKGTPAHLMGKNEKKPEPTKGELVREDAEAAPEVERPEIEISDKDLMLCFESLGENCEFGLVQRRCGAEPLGLFRFSSAPYKRLLDAVKSGFVGLGAPENIEVQESGRDYMVYDKQYGFLYHAWVEVNAEDPRAITAREEKRLPLLIRKLKEELAEGGKLFVFHGMEPLTLDQARELSGALRSYGRTTLLWLELADEAHPPGTVEWIDTGRLIKGYMDRFAPGENAHDLSLECWIETCRRAYALWQNA